MINMYDSDIKDDFFFLQSNTFNLIYIAYLKLKTFYDEDYL